MDANLVKQSLDDLAGMFRQQMTGFEAKLQKTSSNPSTEALTTEFSAFKAFVMSSMRALQAQIDLLAKETDQLEMRSRRKILLFHGVPEDLQETTAEVVAKTVVQMQKQVPLAAGDISRCHRMGRVSSPNKPRPILCKFRDVGVRDKIWSAKASLKGTGITISEFLTKARHSVFMLARERFGLKNTWSAQGQVFVLSSEGVRYRVCCQRDLDDIPHDCVQKPTTATVAPKTRAKALKK